MDLLGDDNDSRPLALAASVCREWRRAVRQSRVRRSLRLVAPYPCAWVPKHIRHSYVITCATWCFGGLGIALGCADRSVIILDTITGAVDSIIPPDNVFNDVDVDMTLSDDGHVKVVLTTPSLYALPKINMIAASTAAPWRLLIQDTLYEIVRGGEPRRVAGICRTTAHSSVTFSESMFAITNSLYTVGIYDSTDGHFIRTLNEFNMKNRDIVRQVRFSEEGPWLAVYKDALSITIYNTKTWTHKMTVLNTVNSIWWFGEKLIYMKGEPVTWYFDGRPVNTDAMPSDYRTFRPLTTHGFMAILPARGEHKASSCMLARINNHTLTIKGTFRSANGAPITHACFSPDGRSVLIVSSYMHGVRESFVRVCSIKTDLEPLGK